MSLMSRQTNIRHLACDGSHSIHIRDATRKIPPLLWKAHHSSLVFRARGPGQWVLAFSTLYVSGHTVYMKISECEKVCVSMHVQIKTCTKVCMDRVIF